MTFCKKFKELRIKAGVSQVDISKTLGCTPQYVSNVERGISSFTPENLRKVCDTYGFSYKTLSKKLVQQKIKSLAKRASDAWDNPEETARRTPRRH